MISRFASSCFAVRSLFLAVMLAGSVASPTALASASGRQLIQDPLTSPELVSGEAAKQARGGEFTNKGWRAKKNGDFLMIEIADAQGFEGKLEVDLHDLDWAKANTAEGKDKIQFLGMFSNPRAELHVEDGGTNQDALWSLRGGTAPDGAPAYGNRFAVLQASRGAKRAEPSDFEESVVPMVPGWKWDKSSYTFCVTWSKTKGELVGYVDGQVMFHEPWVNQVSPLKYIYLAKGPDFHTFIGPSFSNLRVHTVDVTGAPVNQTPTISFLQPRNGAAIAPDVAFEASVDASDDGSIAKVEFFAGDKKLGEVTRAPYRLEVPSLPSGWYALTAKATDNQGAVSVSRPQYLTVGVAWHPWGLIQGSNSPSSEPASAAPEKATSTVHAQPIPQWSLFEHALSHPTPPADPLRGVELRTEFTAPDGKVTKFWGYHDGGATWRFRFSPNQIGRWRYTARFSDGAAAAAGEFVCTASDLPGPLTRWRENPIWFATTAGGPTVVRSFHLGDRFFAENFSAATRTQFLDWAQAQGYNMLSIGSHYLNRNSRGRGQGWMTPQLWDSATKSVRPGEYTKAEAILDDLRARRFYVYPFAGFIGRHSQFPTDSADQELYIRYTLARFAPYWNVLLNVSGPEPLWKPEGYDHRMPFAEVNRLGELIHRLDPFGRLLSVHNASGDDPFRFASWASYSTLQGGGPEKRDDYFAVHGFIFRNHTGDRPIYAQEVLWPGNYLHGGLTPDQVRRKALVMMFAISTINFADMNGDSSTGYSGTMDPAERRLDMHAAIKSAWDFFAKIPFARFRPTWDVVKKGVCMADGQREYWVYLAKGGTTEFSNAFPAGWRGEWIAPDGNVAPAAVQVEGQKSFTPPAAFANDVALHLWRE